MADLKAKVVEPAEAAEQSLQELFAALQQRVAYLESQMAQVKAFAAKHGIHIG